MAPSDRRDQDQERIDREAADWFARMRAPDAASDRAAFEAWRAASPGHAEAYAQLDRLWDQTAFLASSAIGRAARLQGRGARWWGTLPAIAAALALAVGAFIFLVSNRNSGHAGQEAIALETRPSEQRAIGLADGSAVILDQGTKLSVQYGTMERRIRLLAGHARFDVAHDAARPFIVEAGSGQIIARGTMFEVRVRHAQVEVQLLRGAIDVSGERSGKPSPSQRLMPGLQSGFDASGRLFSMAPAKPDHWARTMLEVDSVPLAILLDAANLGARQRIVLSDASLGNLRVTGTFSLAHPAPLARKLAATFALRVDERRNGDIALAPR